MFITNIYLDPKDVNLLEQLMVYHGYVPGKQLGRSISIFLQQLLEQPFNIPRPLERNTAKHYQANRYTINMPSAVENLPERYGLKDWSDVVINIARGNLRPETYPDSLLVFSEAAIESYQFATPVQEYYAMIAIDQDQMETLLYPILPPDNYKDNRPEINIIAQDAKPRASWYVPDLPRKRNHIVVDISTKELLLDISEHFYILHPYHLTEISRITVTIEALYCRLLLPTVSHPSLLRQ